MNRMGEAGAAAEHINSIIRATNILELFGKLNAEYLGVAEISKELQLHKTTVFRVVKTLEHQGWLIQDTPNGKYRLSSKLIALASSVSRNFSVDDLIIQEMKDLRDKFNEDVVLTGIVEDIAVCLEKIQSKNVLRIHSKVGRTTSMVRGSTGKTILAFLPQNKIDAVLSRNFPNTEQGEQEKDALLCQLEKIREQGYCATTSELDLGISSITVPVFGRNQTILYSLGLLGEEIRMEQKGVPEMLRCLQESAKRIEDEISIINEN